MLRSYSSFPPHTLSVHRSLQLMLFELQLPPHLLEKFTWLRHRENLCALSPQVLSWATDLLSSPTPSTMVPLLSQAQLSVNTTGHSMERALFHQQTWPISMMLQKTPTNHICSSWANKEARNASVSGLQSLRTPVSPREVWGCPPSKEGRWKKGRRKPRSPLQGEPWHHWSPGRRAPTTEHLAARA